MKNITLLFFLLYFLVGCNEQKLTNQETVTSYFKARGTADYTSLKMLVNDSITITAGDYVMQYDQAGFYEQFKWDSVFKPSYKIVDLEVTNNQVVATVALNSIRNTFLKNEAMTCPFKFSFNSGKISKIEELECTGVDWSIWAKERDSLVEWIKMNHPEFDNFINDMTVIGATNYIKAIELYEIEKSDL